MNLRRKESVMNKKENIFDGSDIDQNRDGRRLATQYDIIFNIMKDGVWRSVRQLRKMTGFPENSIQSQMRHSRKKRNGSHTVNKKYKTKGLFIYQLIVNPAWLDGKANQEANIRTNTDQTDIPIIEPVTDPVTEIDNLPAPIAELPPPTACQQIGKKPGHGSTGEPPLFLFLVEQNPVESTGQVPSEIS